MCKAGVSRLGRLVAFAVGVVHDFAGVAVDDDKALVVGLR